MIKNGMIINVDTLDDSVASEDRLEVKGNKYFYKGNVFSKKDWFQVTNTFSVFSKEKIQSRYIVNIHPVYQKLVFLENINYATKIALLFPAILFSIITGLIILFLIFINKLSLTYQEATNLRYYFVFIAMLFSVFSAVLIIKYFIGYRMYISKKHGKISFNHLDKIKYQEMINCFDGYIKNYGSKRLNSDESIKVRHISFYDLFDYYEILSNRKVVKYLLTKPIKSLYEVLKKINIHLKDYSQGIDYRLAIANKENKMVGFIGISKVGLTKEQCEIVYGLNHQYWYQGLTSKALQKFIPELIDKGFKKIIATHVEKNVNSGKVLLKSGFEANKDLNRIMRYNNKNYHLIGYEYKEKE